MPTVRRLRTTEDLRVPQRARFELVARGDARTLLQAEGFGDANATSSAMPPMGQLLNLAGIRDIVEFLATRD